MLDDLDYADNLKAAQDAALRPPPVPKQAASFSAWKTTVAAPRGVVAGGAQSGAFLSDVLGAFGQVLDATGTASAGGMFSTQSDAERKQSEQQAQKIRAGGPDFSSATGDDLRGFARFLAPDPETAHTAERMVFDLSRVATKAVGYSVAAGGPLGGATLAGADEGMTTADDLKQQGVDLGTRTAVGAVVGGVTGLGVALPVAGTTAKQTAALVATGGPLSFMAQQQAVRSILQAQDYSKLAEQYDPFDPVGLAVSTLIPAGFGAWGLRASKARAAASAKAAEAQAAREFSQGPIPSEETPIARAAREASQEYVDAARVMLDIEQRRSTNPLGDDMRAADAHETALVKAADQMARGERVAVDDVAPRAASPERSDAEWIADVERVFRERGGVGALDNSTDIAAKSYAFARLAEREGFAVSDPGAKYFTVTKDLGPDADGYAREIVLSVRVSDHSNINRGQHFNDTDINIAPDDGYPRDTFAAALELMRRADVDDEGNTVIGGIRKDDLSIYQDPEARAAQIAEWQKDRAISEASNSPIADWQVSVNAAIQEMRQAVEAMQPKEPPRAAEPAAPESAAPEPQAAAPAAPARAAEPAGTADSARPAAAGAKAGLVEDAAAAARVDEVMAQAPDLMVQLDGMDKPMRVDELLAQVKAEADDMLADGDLMATAAQCALSVGA